MPPKWFEKVKGCWFVSSNLLWFRGSGTWCDHYRNSEASFYLRQFLIALLLMTINDLFYIIIHCKMNPLPTSSASLFECVWVFYHILHQHWGECFQTWADGFCAGARVTTSAAGLLTEAGEHDSARNGPTAGRRQSHISPSLMHCSHTERPAQHSQHSKEQ